MKFGVLILVVCVTSCSQPDCRNRDPVFDKYSSGTARYQNELFRKTQAIPNILYWIDGYEECGCKQYMRIRMSSKDLCAVAYMDITTVARFRHYKQVKGISYTGAQLLGLEYKWQCTDSFYYMQYKNLKAILD